MNIEPTHSPSGASYERKAHTDPSLIERNTAASESGFLCSNFSPSHELSDTREAWVLPECSNKDIRDPVIESVVKTRKGKSRKGSFTKTSHSSLDSSASPVSTDEPPTFEDNTISRKKSTNYRKAKKTNAEPILEWKRNSDEHSSAESFKKLETFDDKLDPPGRLIEDLTTPKSPKKSKNRRDLLRNASTRKKMSVPKKGDRRTSSPRRKRRGRTHTSKRASKRENMQSSSSSLNSCLDPEIEDIRWVRKSNISEQSSSRNVRSCEVPVKAEALHSAEFLRRLKDEASCDASKDPTSITSGSSMSGDGQAKAQGRRKSSIPRQSSLLMHRRRKLKESSKCRSSTSDLALETQNTSAGSRPNSRKLEKRTSLSQENLSKVKLQMIKSPIKRSSSRKKSFSSSTWNSFSDRGALSFADCPLTMNRFDTIDSRIHTSKNMVPVDICEFEVEDFSTAEFDDPSPIHPFDVFQSRLDLAKRPRARQNTLSRRLSTSKDTEFWSDNFFA